MSDTGRQPGYTRPEWTIETVNRFWDHFAESPDTSGKYFSRMWATQLTKLLRDTGRLKGKLLDYGCGPGYLLERLAQESIDCFGCDPSPESVQQTNERLRRFSNWHGCVKVDGTPTSYESHTFDVITCIETIEHLPDQILNETIAEISRLLKPGGMVLITTPFNEDLEANMHYCPFCDSKFHRMQHVQTWQLSDVELLLRRHHIEPFFCRDMRLASYGNVPTFGSVLDFGLRRLAHVLKFELLSLLDRLKPRPFPLGRVTQTYDLRTSGRNLIAIGMRN